MFFNLLETFILTDDVLTLVDTTGGESILRGSMVKTSEGGGG